MQTERHGPNKVNCIVGSPRRFNKFTVLKEEIFPTYRKGTH